MICDVNNHIHTTYSFSPYTPAQAVQKAKEAGLAAAGIVDHDTVAGAPEFLKAGELYGLPVTVGFEMRVYHAHTAVGKRRTNHPDQADISYLTFHAVPQKVFPAVTEFLEPVRAARGHRNREMCERLGLNYERDVLPLSMYHDGGSVTERHILFALAKGDYAEMGRLKAEFREYIPAGRAECPDIETALAFAAENGIIAAYPYLGDVTVSVTGDKKPQAFEDGYLEELMEILHNLGIRAITYMPSRNTREQLLRLRALCDRYSMLQICGEDINSPDQPFVCEALRDPFFDNLRESTWLLIRNERASLPHRHDLDAGRVLESMPDVSRFEAAASVFQQLCDGSRLRIFWMLCHCEECGINIAAALGMSSAAVSHHLRLLKLHGLITSRRDGKEVYYSLAKTQTAQLVHKIVDDFFEIVCPKA